MQGQELEKQQSSLSLPEKPNQFKQMQAYFQERTSSHVERVVKNMSLLTGYKGLTSEQLYKRAQSHDLSKFYPPQRQGYIWLTHYHHLRKEGNLNYEYPSEKVKKLVADAVNHHLKTNRHHPQSFRVGGKFYQRENNTKFSRQSSLDVVEMVCDWTAMSQEYGQDCCDVWLKANIGKFDFTEIEKSEIWTIVEILNQRNGLKGISQHPQFS